MGARHALPEREGEEPEDEPDDEEYDGSAADTATLATELLSWAIGVAFGRFDIRHATGELPAPIEPGPFDPLPARSPGMCPDDSLAVAFLVDDPGHALDLGKRIADVFAAVFPADHEARLDEAVRLAGSSDLQAFLRRTYFSFHLKRYSKSRRKAPIWWPLSTANGTYTVWLAWPQLTRDTLFRVADEIKRQKLPFETRRLVSLKQEHGPNPTSRDKATIAAQEDLVSELSALLEEIERVAPLWNPVPDDGVILHYALLWRVVRDAAWQKECRSAWDKLAKGDYDWAHVAMHLWPERVAPKCRSDRSLAIAHGLEDTFWVEVGGKWRARLSIDEEALLASTRLLDLFTVAAFKELRKWAVDRGDATAFDSWWTQLGSGQNETDPVALLLWPERVFERCRRDREFAHVHKLEGLFGSALSDRSGSGRATTWAERLADHRPAEMSALVQAIDDAIGRLRAEGSAAGFWESLDAGAFDDMALARLVRPSAAVSRARADLAVAEAHGLTDTFWLLGRKRVDPERESEVAIAARTSTAIKSALRAFVEAPSPGRSARGKRGG